MWTLSQAVGLVALAAAPAGAEGPVPQLSGVPFEGVEIQDAFWSPRIRVNREVTIPHILDMCELEGRVRNMLRAAGKLEGEFEGTRRHDADLFKAIEAASYSLALERQPELAERVDRIIDAIAAAQQEDGYLHSYRTVRGARSGTRSDLQLFAAGHLIDAGLAHHQATGDRRLLEVATRFADLMGATVGPGGRPEVPSHPKIEASLVELYRVTGRKRYLELARYFLDERGCGQASGRRVFGLHTQDERPVRQLDAAEGHVICALFLWEGMLEVGLATGDDSLVAACKRVYDDATTRRMYVTGAMGRSSDERFSAPYDLDGRASIGEGCQSAALIRLSAKLHRLEGDARYVDVIERVLYNNLPANVGWDGRSFYYVNRLSARREDATGRPYAHPLAATQRERLPRFCLARQPWFKVPCCPPNVAMAIATLGEHVYARSPEAIYVNLYLGSRASIPVAGTTVRISQTTRYPWSGEVNIRVDPAESRSFKLMLRIPDFGRRLESTGGLYRIVEPAEIEPVVVKINGQPIGVDRLEKGYLPIARKWQRGDLIELRLPLPIMRIVSHPQVAANRDRVALARGPVVYCVEAVDHGGDVRGLWLPPEAELACEHRPELLGGVTALTGTAMLHDPTSATSRAAPFLAVPYAVWSNRAPGEMDVWLRQSPPATP
jgi:DUF1680 family protein